MKKTKYTYIKVLQGNYGYGWDDLEEAEKNNNEDIKELRQDLKAYRSNENARHRIIERRILN